MIVKLEIYVLFSEKNNYKHRLFNVFSKLVQNQIFEIVFPGFCREYVLFFIEFFLGVYKHVC